MFETKRKIRMIRSLKTPEQKEFMKEGKSRYNTIFMKVHNLWIGRKTKRKSILSA